MSADEVLNQQVAAEGKKFFRFESFELDPARRRLTFEGRPVAIGDRALDILILLTSRAGEVVPKDELISHAWPNTFVHEANLKVHVSALRRILGKKGRGEGPIVNVVGRGYMFAAVGGEPVREAARDQAPPLAAIRPPTNLPQPPNSLIGRDGEMLELRKQFEGRRLVTLTGSGGIGKTRLALEFGWQMPELFPDGVWLVDLAAFSGPSVALAVAMVLGASVDDETKADEAVLNAVGARRMLLILDNCEYHVQEVAALVAGLLSRATAVFLLVTSQEALNITVEQVMRLNPLVLPPAGAADIGTFGAVALLAERAQAADQRFALNGRNAEDVAEICRRLDGIPLALEIAASWFPVLGAAGVRAELDKLLIMPGRRMADSRHRTVQDMVEWSHNLLDSPDQTVFRRLAVFTGMFSLEAALAVAGPDAERWNVINAIGRLIDKSLVAVEGLEPPRYRLLETLRLFARQRLEAAGEEAEMFERHAQCFLAFLTRARTESLAMPVAEYWARYAQEWENTRAAILWSFEKPERNPLALRLVATANYGFLQQPSLVGEGRRFINNAVDLIDDTTPPDLAAQLYRSGGHIWLNSNPQRALPLLQRAAELFLKLDQPANFANTASSIGNMQYFLGRYEEAKATFERCREIFEPAGDNKGLLHVFYGLGLVAASTDDLAGARRQFSRALETAQLQKDAFLEQYVLLQIAELDFMEGNADAAIGLMQQVIGRLQSILPRLVMHEALHNLGVFLIAQGRLAEARECAAQALEEVHEGDSYMYKLCAQQWALLAAFEGRFTLAAKLIGFVDASIPNANKDGRTAANYVYAQLTRLLENALPASERGAHGAEGRAWDAQQAAAFVKKELIEQAAAT